MATMSLLGVGNNILNNNTLDQLRSIQYNSQVKPIENNILTTQQKQKQFDEFKNLFDTFKKSVSELSDKNLFLQREVQTSNDNIGVRIDDGTNIQSFDIDIITKTKKDVNSTKSFSSIDTNINNSGLNQTLKLTQNGIDYDININPDMTLTELKDAINEQSNGNIKADLLKVNENGEQVLSISSVNSGENNRISFSGDIDILNTLDIKNTQLGTDTLIKYNGTLIQRNNNIIDDLIPGISLTINGMENSSTKIDVVNNKEILSTKVKDFVSNYNNLFKKIQEMTQANPDGVSGLFNGDRTFRDILSNINRSINDMDTTLGKSLSQNGISILRDGELFLEKNIFDNVDFEDIEKLFSGDNGTFTKMDNYLDNISKYNSTLDSMENGLNTLLKSLEKNKVRTEDLLNKRFETMAQKFTSYSSIINSFESSSNFMNQQIMSLFNTQG